MHRMYSVVVGLTPDPIRCRRVVTESCKLRWSSETADFSPDSNCQFKSNPDQLETSGSPSWCVSKAKSQSVRIKFEFFSNGRLVEMTNCRIDSNRACKWPCMALDIDRQSGVISNTVDNVLNVRVVLPTGAEIQRYTAVNASADNGQLTRFVRRATLDSLASSNFHRTHRYQRRRQRRRRKNRRRRARMKMIASEFITELIDKARRLGATDRSSLTSLLRHNSKLSSQVEKIRSYDTNRQSTHVEGSAFQRAKNISARYDYAGGEDDKRFKRDPENARASAENLRFCRLTPQRVIAARGESRLATNEVLAKPGRWITPALPYTILADEPLVILKLSDLSKLGRALLKYLVISIEYDDTFAFVKPKTVATELISSSSTAVSRPSILNSSPARPLANNITTAAIAIAGGLLFLIVTVAALMLLPRSRSGRFPRSKSRRCDCPSVSESENRLYLADSVEDKTTSECSERKSLRENSVDEIVSENTLTMLECKRCTRERNKGKSRRSCANFKSAKAASDRSSTCRHAAGIVGSSRHDHCIVCQIAEKPHAPIVDAQQYTSQVLPSPDRQTRGAAGSVDRDDFDLYRGGVSLANAAHDSVSSLPQTVRLPDGEEIRRGEQRRLGGLMTQGSPYRVCVKAPPNRTVYSCDALPFAPFNNNGPRLKAADCKGQPAGHNKHKNCAGPAAKDSARTQLAGRAYSCRCLVSHMGDPPPDYSDVVS